VNTRFALSMARRELRASRRRFALYGGCMALGIAALVALQGLRETVRGAVAAESRSLLGADLRLESRTPFDEATLALLERLHEGPEETTGRITRFASMALVPRSGRTRLVDVQAVGGTFPLHGEVRTDPPEAWPRLRGEELVAVVDRSLLVQLEAEVGDALALGEARFEIAGSIVRAPGTFGMRTRVAPRVFIARRAVEETGLVRPGSLVEHLLYARADEARLRPWLDRHRERLLAARVRVQTVAGYEESLSRSFGTLSRYLGLVGLAALALGGVGVAAGARVFVREKLDTVAVLRALGARSNDVLAAYGLLALALGAVAGTAGAAIGAVLQWVLPWLLRAFLLWLTLLFAGGPLLDLGRVPPLRALRRDFTAGRAALTGRVLLVGAVALTLLAASLWQAPRPALGLAFAGGLAGAIALLAAAAGVTMRALRRHPLRRAPFWLRQGVANLFRPRNHTLASVLAVGFGLFVVATLQIVRHNVLAQIASDTSPDRPNLVLFDVQRDQLDAVRALAEERGARLVEQAPIVSLRIARLAGREVSEQLRAETMSRDLRWALRREYRATYSGELRETETISSGRWWSPDDLGGNAPAGVSLETEIAALLGVAPGDSIAWDVQGVRLDSVVRSLRDVNWDRLATNFFVIFSPGVLEEAPQSLVLLLRLPGADARAAFQRDLVGRFANVSALDATVILAAVDSLLGELGFAVRLLALFTLATGLSVLVAAGASARHERTREALLLRTLGASSRTVRRIVACEALALAAIAAAVGAGLALAASWALVRFVFELPFGAPLGELAALSLGTVAATAALGAASGGTRRARSPLAALREAELSGATALLLLALA
jgi:putative ABC transport system permease protein